jgi:hypothetical protein
MNINGGPAHLPGFFFAARFGLAIFFATRCCGGLFDTTETARSKHCIASV